MQCPRALVSLLAVGLIAACSSTPLSPPSPPAPPGPIDPPDILSAAREVMAAAGFCALITLGQDGRPQARVMDPTAPDERMAVTLMTNPASRKVGQIERDDRVTLFYFDPAGPAYVTILGRAIPILDAAEKKRRWVDRWSPHIGGPEAALLYEVVPDRIEVVSVPLGVFPDRGTWTPRAVDFN